MIVFGIVLLVCLFCWALVYTVIKVLRDSDATKAALKLVESNIEVMELLGAPLKIGFWVSGSIAIWIGFNLYCKLCRRGVASLTLPLHGSRREGRLKVKLELRSGVWQPYFASIRIGDRSVLLIDGGGPKGWLKRFLSRFTS